MLKVDFTPAEEPFDLNSILPTATTLSEEPLNLASIPVPATQLEMLFDLSPSLAAAAASQLEWSHSI